MNSNIIRLKQLFQHFTPKQFYTLYHTNKTFRYIVRIAGGILEQMKNISIFS